MKKDAEITVKVIFSLSAMPTKCVPEQKREKNVLPLNDCD